jgi:energy-coupling factor transporter ATP-binding protein EcfA2
MLEKVAFKNFLALRDVEVDLEPFTVIVGPNACGKSTLLEGIHRICGVKNGYADCLVQGGDFIPGRSSPKFSVDQIQSATSNGTLVFSVALSKNPLDKAIFTLSENKLFWRLTTSEFTSKPFGLNVSSVPGEVSQHTFSAFPNSIYLKPNGAQMLKAAYSPLTKPFLESDGAGLAVFFDLIRDEYEDRFLPLLDSVKKVIPSIISIRTMRENIDWTGWVNTPEAEKPQNPNVIGKKLIFDFQNASDIPADFVSEGTLISLCIFAATAGATDNHIVLLDDIERGLHPRAIKDLIAQLRALQQLNPGLQIVATTHSPYVLDYLEGHEIRVATHDPERGMLIAPLNKHPDFERWSEAMDPGQFWSHVGESWVAELQEKTAADD